MKYCTFKYCFFLIDLVMIKNDFVYFIISSCSLVTITLCLKFKQMEHTTKQQQKIAQNKIHVVLTSREARQYQQKTCLHRLHIIWAQPSSFSMGTAHIGQHLMSSESNVMPGMGWFKSYTIVTQLIKRMKIQGEGTRNKNILSNNHLYTNISTLLISAYGQSATGNEICKYWNEKI